jgi:nucleotide-binding universal stress UspA family protein
MATKIIVSYDGTDGDRDALALGRVLAAAGGSLALAYVRHAQEAHSGRERLAEKDAMALLDTGAATLGQPDIPRHVVVSGSTPEGLRELALAENADLIVFGSEYRTAPGHVDPQSSARRLLQGGPVAIAVAPSGFAEETYAPATVVALTEDGDPSAIETAESLAARLGASVAASRSAVADLLVVGSKPGVVTGRVTISAAAEYVIELSRCPVIVLPRGVALSFASRG